jgi:hypothetical protein
VLADAGSMLYHRNALPADQTYMTKAMLNTNIPPVPVAEFTDPLNNRSSGIKVSSVHAVASTSTTVAVSLLTAQTNTASEYEVKLRQLAEAYIATFTPAATFPSAEHLGFWADKCTVVLVCSPCPRPWIL